MKKRIIVIDDQADVRNAFKLALEDAEIDMDIAASGEAGLMLIKNNHYDLVYLDLKMPGMNGVETLRKIRKIKPDVPVYFITAFSKEFTDQLKEIRNEGADFDLLEKPIGLEEINQITAGILGNAVSY